MSTRWSSLYRLGWVVAGILLAIGAVFVFGPQLAQQQELQREKDAKEARAAELDEQIDALQKKQERFENDPSYVERVARETGRVKPDEVVIRYENNPQPNP